MRAEHLSELEMQIRESDLGTINAASLKKAHERVEMGCTRGKIVLAGF
jgi:hypothetical protein